MEGRLVVKNYENPNDFKDGNQKCEIFPNIDFCDPVFHICIYSKSPCDIYKVILKGYEQQKMVESIFSHVFQFDRNPNNIRVTIKVYDADLIGNDEFIGTFRHSLKNIILNKLYHKTLHPYRHLFNVRIETEFQLVCSKYYYGINCIKFCKPKHEIYRCDNDGNKICTLKCQFNEKCIQTEIDEREFTCVCKIGYYGQECNFNTVTTIIKLSSSKSITSTTKGHGLFKSSTLWDPSNISDHLTTKNFTNNTRTTYSYDTSTKLNRRKMSISIIYILVPFVVALFIIFLLVLFIYYINHKNKKKDIRNSRPLPPIKYCNDKIEKMSLQTISSYFPPPSNMDKDIYDAYTLPLEDPTSVYYCYPTIPDPLKLNKIKGNESIYENIGINCDHRNETSLNLSTNKDIYLEPMRLF